MECVLRFGSFPSSLLLITLFLLFDPRSSTSPRDDTTTLACRSRVSSYFIFFSPGTWSEHAPDPNLRFRCGSRPYQAEPAQNRTAGSLGSELCCVVRSPSAPWYSLITDVLLAHHTLGRVLSINFPRIEAICLPIVVLPQSAELWAEPVPVVVS